MSLRHYGIYLAYGPTVDLRKEGLGRVLADFLRAADAVDDVRFVIVCPEWSRKGLQALFDSERIPTDRLEIVSTRGIPFALRLYLARRFKPKRVSKPSWFAIHRKRLQAALTGHRRRLERGLLSTRSVVVWFAVAIYGLALGGVLLLPLALYWLAQRVWRTLRASVRMLPLAKWMQAVLARLTGLLLPDGDEPAAIRFYRLMEESESERLIAIARSLKQVRAWYCPTAFWPAFNRIDAPRLMCVPDVLPTEFPTGFAMLEPELMKNFEIIEQSIQEGGHFLTYSQQIKWETLVRRYAVPPDRIAVIPHAACNLRSWIEVKNFEDSEHATRRHCEQLLGQALARVGTSAYHGSIAPGSVRFLFYASQFRPNKNIETLLRAYEYLVRERFLPHKLILTGDPGRYPRLRSLIEDRGLQREVICLHGLTTPELAACYRLADLAVNPSLSEGGCPFTLTEALSVNTPVVMARIPVTEEVITEKTLSDRMLFDPYDWSDAASRIEWAIDNRESLLAAQQTYFARLRQRSWRDVVDESVAVLDRIAATPAGVSGGAS